MPRNLGFSDGSSMSVDRTREAGERTLGFSDGSNLKVNRAVGKKDDRAGESRPLLGKLVGRSAIAYSLRDLHDKQGNNKVVRVRRGADNLEKDFKANELSSIVDWSNNTDVFVTIWYDQGGGNYHFTQDNDTLQPKIVNNGVYLGGLNAPVNNATSGSKVHMTTTFRNQNFPANTTGISYFLVGNDLSADQGNNKGTLLGSFRGVANYAEGQQGLALDGMTKFGFYNGLTTNANHYQYKTVVVPNTTFPNKTVLLVASLQDKKGTLYVNEATNSGDMSRVGGTALENLNLESDSSVDADRNYIRLFAPNRDMAYRAHNYSYGTIKEVILYPSSNSDNLEAIRDNINNQYQIY